MFHFFKSDEYYPRKYMVVGVEDDDFGRWKILRIKAHSRKATHYALLYVKGDIPNVEVGDWVSFDDIDGAGISAFTTKEGEHAQRATLMIPEGKLRVYLKGAGKGQRNEN